MSLMDDVLATEFSERFVALMKNRMVVSFHKYGRVADTVGRVDRLKSLRQRLQRYEETGNTEWLVDAANFAMIEFMHPAHAEAHFRGTDSDESPGRVRADGRNDASPNLPADLAVQKLKDRMAREGD